MVATFDVRAIGSSAGKAFIREHHYSRSCHNGPVCWGLFKGDDLIGVIAFATPCSENVRASVFGAEHKDRVVELHRLVILDVTPKNTESWFIARALKAIAKYKPQLRAVISFADVTEGHVGTIYQASNAIYAGTTPKARFWRDADGRLRHPRQNGKNISVDTAKSLGWAPEMREGKHRYVFLVNDRRWGLSNIKWQAQPYPKRDNR